MVRTVRRVLALAVLAALLAGGTAILPVLWRMAASLSAGRASGAGWAVLGFSGLCGLGVAGTALGFARALWIGPGGPSGEASDDGARWDGPGDGAEGGGSDDASSD